MIGFAVRLTATFGIGPEEIRLREQSTAPKVVLTKRYLLVVLTIVA